MSKYHGEQYWSQLRQQTLQGWHEISEDEIEQWHSIRHSRDVQARDQRARARRDRRGDVREVEL
jgi:hypothetical protein